MLGSAGSMRAVLSMPYKAETLMHSLQQHAEGERCARRRHVYEEQGRKGDVTVNHIRKCDVLCFDVSKMKAQASPAAERPV